MKHKTWGEMVQSRDPEASDLQSNSSRDPGDEEEEDTDPQQGALDRRNNILFTRFLMAASFVCGVVIAQRGPSILDLGAVTVGGSDFSSFILHPTVSLFAFGAVGQMLGGVGAGLLLGRLDTGSLLFWVLLIMGITTLALPWFRSYGMLAGVYCLSLVCVGCVETGSYAEIAKRWKSKGGEVVQKLQLWFVVGAMISPGMTQFFMDPRYRHHHASQDVTSGYNETGQSDSGTTTAVTTSGIISTVDSATGSNSGNESHSGMLPETTSDVFIAYIISGALAFLASVPFLVRFFLTKKNPSSGSAARPPRKRRGAPAVSRQLLLRDASMPVLLLVALFVFLVTAVEESMHQFLFTFMIREAGWSTQAAAWVTSWFWAGVLLVRAVAYFAPDQLADEAILALSCLTLPCTLAGLHASVIFGNSDGVWACVFFAGMAVSLVFPVSFTWIHTGLAQRASAVSCVVMSSTLVAGIVNPLVLGQFLHSGGRHEGFTLLLTAQAVLALLVFLLLLLLSRRLSARWHQASARKSIHVVAPRGGRGRGRRGRDRLEEEGLQDSQDV